MADKSVKKGIRLITLALLICALLPLYCVNGQAASQRAVRIGWYQSDLFQEGMSDDAHKSGYSYNYIHKIADYTGWTYEYVYGDWTELLAMLESGEIDLLAGVSKTEERLSKLLYPNEIMGSEHYVLYQNSGNKTMDAADLSTFKGKQIGAIKNNLMTACLEGWLADRNTGAVIVYYDSFGERDADFDEGKLDAIVTTDSGILTTSGYSQITRVGSDAYYLAVAWGRSDLLYDMNRALSYIQDIDPYYLSTLEFECYGTTMANSTLTALEEEWVGDHPVMRVGCLSNYLPYCGTDENGSVYGLVTDVMDAILTETGISGRVGVEYIAFDGGEALFVALKRGEIDVAFPVGGETWQIEREGIKATNHVITSTVNLVFKGDYSDKTTSSFAVTAGNTMMRNYIEAWYPDAVLTEYPSIADCLDAVADGKVGVTTLNGMRSDIVYKNSSYDSLTLMRLGRTDGRSFGVATDSTGLQMLLNRGLKLTGQDLASSIAYNYMNDLYQVTVGDFIRQNLGLCAGILGLFVMVILALILRYQRKTTYFLRREEEKNAELLVNQQKLEESRSEQEAQIEEITALNSELEERQAQLEEVSAEQESQIEEINALNSKLEERMTIIQSMGKVYFTAFYIDLVKDEFMELTSYDSIRSMVGRQGNARAAIKVFCRQLVKQEFIEEADSFMNLETLDERLKGHTFITFKYIGAQSGSWCQGFFIEGDRDAAGRLIHAFFATRDISEEKAVEDEQNRRLQEARKAAENANSAKSTFLFNMSHDIRTPMNAIIGFRNLLEKYQDDPEKRADYLRKIADSSNVLLSIINNVLEMARIEKGTVAIDETAWSAEQFNDSVYSIFIEMMEEKSIKFTRSVSIQHPYVFCDTIKVREIFINILSNACKYTQPGGSVHMSLEELPCEREGYAIYRTTISDTGIGMSEDFLPHIFEEFAREHNTTDNKIEGTGLGMPIVKRLVELMGGTIEVKSKKGEGSTFTVSIPHRIAERSDFAHYENADANPEQFAGKRILLAEDNDLNAEIAMEILSEAGFVIDRAEDGQICCDMLLKAETGAYSVVLMDIQMPNMNGYEAARTIRRMQDPEKSNIPILAMTANAFEEDKREAIRSGMNGHVAKPIVVQELMRELSIILS